MSEEQTEAVKPFVTGVMETIGSGAVGGWAFDSRDQQRRVRVDLKLDGKYLATVTACLYRHDLRVLGSGDAFHSFYYPLPPEFLDGFNHVLEAFVEGTEQQLEHSPLDGKKLTLARRWQFPAVDHRFNPNPTRNPARRIPRLPRKKKLSEFKPSGRLLDPATLTGVSVIIPTYNRGAMLEETLLRSFECTGGCAVEFIVVDDGSTDDTGERLSRLAGEHSRLRFLRVENGGPGRARNLGIGLATYEVILFQGDDIRPVNSAFYRLHLEAHRQLPNVGVAVLGKSVWPDSQDEEVTFCMRHIQGKGQQQFGYFSLVPYTWLDWRFFYTSNVSLKKQVLSNWAEDGFNPRFRDAAWEDAELAYRLSEVTPGGFGTLYLPGPTATHHHFYQTRQFIERQISAGRAAQVFCRMHPNLRRKIGVEELERVLTLPVVPADLHTPRADLISLIEGLQAWACLLEAEGTLGQSAWHDDLLAGVFTISYLHGYVMANEYPWANYDAAYRFVVEQFQTAVHHAGMFEVFGRVPPLAAIAPTAQKSKVEREAAVPA
jgi:glycosyltransferase involved in cell wall biosynthesis